MAATELVGAPEFVHNPDGTTDMIVDGVLYQNVRVSRVSHEIDADGLQSSEVEIVPLKSSLPPIDRTQPYPSFAFTPTGFTQTVTNWYSEDAPIDARLAARRRLTEERREAVERGKEFRASGLERPTREQRTRRCEICDRCFLMDASTAVVIDADNIAAVCWDCL